jgi:drug/metabolite transporter (DMT)-like permease
MLYLSLFWLCSSFFAYHYALTKVSPVQVSILAYINTIISIFLSWLILNEEISAKFIIAAILIILGVFVINYNREMFKKQRIG